MHCVQADEAAQMRSNLGAALDRHAASLSMLGSVQCAPSLSRLHSQQVQQLARGASDAEQLHTPATAACV
jgi:hypothetical protein